MRVPIHTAETAAQRFNHLFLAMSEELKLPLTHIARQAELQALRPLLRSGQDSAVAAAGGVNPELSAELLACLRDIQASADMTLQMLDSYLLGLRLSLEPDEAGADKRLSLEPVSVSAVLHDTVEELRHIAQSYGVTLHLHVQGRYEPVLTNRQALQSALVSVGYALIEALPASGARRQRLQLATHRTKQGIVAGLYGDIEGLTPQAYERSKSRQGVVRQPLVEALPGSGAGLFAADAILAAMSSRLRVGRYQKLPGFAVTLPASEQLQFI